MDVNNSILHLHLGTPTSLSAHGNGIMRGMEICGETMGKMCVLVGTYRPENADWIRRKKLYNLPLPSAADPAIYRKFTVAVLYAGDAAPLAYKVTFREVVDRAWLKANGYSLVKAPHGERYALFALGARTSAAKALSDPQAEVCVCSSRWTGIIDADFYSRPLPPCGGKSIPNVFEKIRPYFTKWKAACAFNPVQMDFFGGLTVGRVSGLPVDRGSKRPVAVDLFAGCGGLSLGFEQAGFDIAAAVEIDPIHAAVHEYNFPHTKTICADIKNVTGEDIRRLSDLGDRDVDVVFGGAPCQGFSMIGKRALDDPRNQLIGHFLRIVSEIRPKYCVLENVRGLTVGKHAKFLSELISELKRIRYSVLLPYRVLNAADYGVPQNRQRLFLIAARAGQALPDYPEIVGEKVTIREAIEDLPNADLFKQLLDCDSVQTFWTTSSHYARKLRGFEDDPDDFGYRREYDQNQLTASMRTIHTEQSQKRFIEAPQGETEPHSRFFKLAWAGQSNTLRAGTDSARGGFTSPRPIHPVFPRVVTVREGARIHSYPDWFRFHRTKWHGFREIGNSVPPILARAVGRSVMKALGIKPEKPRFVITPGDEKLLCFDMREAAEHFGVSRNVIAQRKRDRDGKQEG